MASVASLAARSRRIPAAGSLVEDVAMARKGSQRLCHLTMVAALCQFEAVALRDAAATEQAGSCASSHCPIRRLSYALEPRATCMS